MNNLVSLFRSIDISGKIVIVVILLVFIAAFVINLLIKIQYYKLSKQINNRQNRRAGTFKDEMLNEIVQDYKVAGEINNNNVNTQAIIEKNLTEHLKLSSFGETFVRKSMSMMITLGLLGTFIGLTISVSELVNVLLQDIGSASLDWNEILVRLAAAAKGMGAAFTTSLVGLFGSVILNFALIAIDCEEQKRSLMIDVEEYLDNNVAVLIAKDKETEYTMMNRILKDTFVEFGSKIEMTLKDTVDSFADKLTNVVMDVSVSSQALDTTVERFDSAISTLAVAMKDMSDFNVNLKENVDKMDVSFIKMSESLSDSANLIMKNYDAIRSFAEDVKSAAGQMAVSNKETLEELASLAEQVDQTVSALQQLTTTMKQSSEDNAESINNMKDSFEKAIIATSMEVSSLTEKIKSSFEEALNESSQIIAEKTAATMEKSMANVNSMSESFENNQKILAQTIASLPEQTMVYNKSVSGKIQKKLDDIEKAIRNE
ncbi:MAG: MotA/TolQ/ExbB proton channel family protein [Clostridia bacterium]|nr:MotA/TolQ/ExbB proton channel family protein [Clostridia bacterium]MDD3094213.1 MotA/TolQ/ExbB proton channel family protein [Clostridia bacterium]MDD4543066.1 MotA/TolQ/ExbB proton channel family protein [Clostridia bacterium]HXK71599.1 MotA/TolQ/ExbB proton channel family protein [Clostridia bacterium]